jgi:hypothetical protein
MLSSLAQCLARLKVYVGSWNEVEVVVYLGGAAGLPGLCPTLPDSIGTSGWLPERNSIRFCGPFLFVGKDVRRDCQWEAATSRLKRRVESNSTESGKKNSK